MLLLAQLFSFLLWRVETIEVHLWLTGCHFIVAGTAIAAVVKLSRHMVDRASLRRCSGCVGQPIVALLLHYLI